jgi:hypothetical protein
VDSIQQHKKFPESSRLTGTASVENSETSAALKSGVLEKIRSSQFQMPCNEGVKIVARAAVLDSCNAGCNQD